MPKQGLMAEFREGLRLLGGLRSNPNIGQDLKRSGLFLRVTRWVPLKFLRHYVYPRFAGRGALPYDPERFFESFYTASGNDDVTDEATLSPVGDALSSRYHYAVTEKVLIECLVRREVEPGGRLLDVGSGAGHWIALYREVLRPSRLVGLDISASSAATLAETWAHAAEVEIRRADVASPDFDLGERFDLVNAIGVMFHIVEDEAWERAIGNLARHLEPGGHLIVGGQFGWITANVQFHGSDDFAAWGEGSSAGPRLVNKRIRSLRRLKGAARRAGLRVVEVRRTREINTLYTPENNLLVLTKPS